MEDWNVWFVENGILFHTEKSELIYETERTEEFTFSEYRWYETTRYYRFVHKKMNAVYFFVRKKEHFRVGLFKSQPVYKVSYTRGIVGDLDKIANILLKLKRYDLLKSDFDIEVE